MIKKSTVFLLVWYAAIMVFVVLSAILPLFNYSILDLSLWISTEQLIFTLVLLIVILTFFLIVLVQTSNILATQGIRQNLRLILQNKSIRATADEDQLLLQLSEKVTSLTRQVQMIDNQDLFKT